MITVQAATKRYGESVQIGPVDLEIPANGLTALVGPNGAGKSTLLTMIGRLLGLDDGVISVGGFDVTSTDSKDLAKILAILRQENHFITRLTVRQLVGFGRFPHTQGRITAHDNQIIDQAIRFLHLEDLQDRFLDQLSGGQRQRAYVAMVLAQDTEYVLLDEPLNNLDIAHSVDMMRHLKEATTKLGKTVVVVLHDLNFASCWADHIVAMRDGRVAATGTPREIVSTDKLREIYGLEIPVSDVGGHPVAHFYLPSTLQLSSQLPT